MSADGPELLVQRAIDEHGRIDVLVNNVGAVRIRVDGFLATSDEEFEWALKMNFFTGLRASRAALGPMLEQGSGSIVNIASVNSFFQPDAATVDYGVAKAAVVNLSKSLSQEFGPKGIRVNCVSPGIIRTRFQDYLTPEQIERNIRDRIPLHREGRPEDVAAALAALAENDFITGVDLPIDGGMTMRMV